MESWSSELPIEEIGRRYGTPLYVFDPGQLAKNFADYVDLVGGAENIKYPVKANQSLEVLRHIAALGGGADCAHESEVYAARLAGIPIEKIVYNSPAPDPSLMVDLLLSGGHVVFDSIESLELLRAKMPDLESVSGKLLIRVSPSVDFKNPGKHADARSAHAGIRGKFGVEEERLFEFLRENPRFPLAGLHLHPGSRLDRIDIMQRALDYLNDLAKRVGNAIGREIDLLDIGGGWAQVYLPTDRVPSLSDLGAALEPRLLPGVTYWVEPGNSLVGDTMCLLARTALVKKKHERRFAILDVGYDQLGYHRPFHILTQRHEPLPRSGDDSLVGPLCFAGDVVLGSTDIGDLKADEFVYFQHAGAYCYSMSNHFNGRQYGGMVKVIDKGAVALCNTREEFHLHSSFTTYKWPR